MNVRPARRDEIPFLTAKAAECGWERYDLEKSLVWVVEVEGVVSGFIDVCLIYQIKNLCIFPEFRRHAPPFVLRRAVFKLAQTATGWIREQPGIRSFIAYIETKRFQKLCREWGMIALPRKGKWYGQDF